MSALPKLMTLAEAAAEIGGKITARSLRTEARRGRLHLTRIAGKDHVLMSDLLEMLERCRNGSRGRASTSEVVEAVRPSGSSETEAKKSAQDAAKATLRMLKERCNGTSPPSTSRPSGKVLLIRS